MMYYKSETESEAELEPVASGGEKRSPLEVVNRYSFGVITQGEGRQDKTAKTSVKNQGLNSEDGRAASHTQSTELSGSSKCLDCNVGEAVIGSMDGNEESLGTCSVAPGGPAKCTVSVASLPVVTCEPVPDLLMAEDSTTLDILRPMAGAVTDVSNTASVTVRMIVPQDTPMLELQGIFVKNDQDRAVVEKMSVEKSPELLHVAK